MALQLRRQIPFLLHSSSYLSSSSSCSGSCRTQFATRFIHSPGGVPLPRHWRKTQNPVLPPPVCTSPWSLIQFRGAKVLGSDVKVGTIIQRKGRTFEVIKAQHSQHGRGGATVQVELRDVDTGNKITERFRTDEAIEKVFVEAKSLNFLYEEGETVFLMEPESFEQLEVPKDVFGEQVAYLKDNMKVDLHYYDGRLISASIPTRVTCTVIDAVAKGQSVNPQYKRIILDNGLTIQAPSFIKVGDEVVINTRENSYMERAKE